jgi:glutamate racemase
VGGLTVFEKLKKLMPNEDYIYFGDTANMPYGEKTPSQLLELTTNAFEFFSKQGVKAVVMACNTTSAVVYDKIRGKYEFKIYPIIQSVAGCLPKVDVLGVFATEATVKSGAWSNAINIACPEWVKMVECGEISEAAVKEKLDEMLAYKPDKIILGCTHYPYLLPVLTKFAPADMFIDPSECFAQFIAADLKPGDGPGSETFYVSGSSENFIKAAKMFYNVKKPVQPVR